MNAGEALARAEASLRRREAARARADFDVAEAHGADAERCAGGRWMASMLLGDFEQAWRESDAIRARGGEDAHRFWSGESVAGKRLIVRSLHGLGDAVQMMRYAPMLKSLAHSVVFEVAPRLVELAGCFDGVDQVVTWGDDAPREPLPWDAHIEIMELPYLFRTTPAALPLRTKYLRLAQRHVDRCAAVMGSRGRPRVGLVGSAGEWNKDREVSPELLRPLLDAADVEIWSLHHAGCPDVLGSAVRDATAECGSSLMDLAAVMANLDLVITVDTLAAHLAGALERPAWVMLQHEADWRWMIGRSDSPWYPQARLFRQAEQGDWSRVVGDVARALNEWTRRRGER